MSTTKIRSSVQINVDADLDVNSHKITNLATPTANTDAATKLYVDGILAAGDAMQYKGVIDCSTNPNYPAANAGDTYKVSVAGNIGGIGGVGVAVLAGDMLVCTADGTSAGTQAAVGTSWNVIHVNAAAGSVTSSSTSVTDNAVVRMDSTTGAVVQTSLVTIDDSGSINLPAGQSYKVNGVALSPVPTFVTMEVLTVSAGTGPFTLANTPTTGSLMLFMNGAAQSVTDDYTLSGANITMTYALISTDKLRATYRC